MQLFNLLSQERFDMKIDMKKNNPMGRTNDIVVQEVNGEVLIYDLSADKAFCLNETSALIWAACDGTRNVSEIGEYASSKLNAPANDDLIWLALDQLNREKLLTNAPAELEKFSGVSRREMIKKVGLGTAIALPIVASLIAPTAAMAQSASCAAPTNRPSGCPCTFSAQCANNSCNCAGTSPGTFICCP